VPVCCVRPHIGVHPDHFYNLLVFVQIVTANKKNPTLPVAWYGLGSISFIYYFNMFSDIFVHP